jgi:hypothetical protein
MSDNSDQMIGETAPDEELSGAAGQGSQQQQEALKAVVQATLRKYQHAIDAVAGCGRHSDMGTMPFCLPGGMAAAVQVLLQREHDALADLFTSHARP